MKRDELEHVIRAAADITEDEIVVVGSQAILAQYPDAPETLLVSMEADVYPRTHPERAGEIDGAIGDGSRFHETYGYYAHGVGPETTVAPDGWQDRLIRLQVPTVVAKRAVTAWCLEIHDLVLAKLAAGRPHDLEYVEEAVREELVDINRLKDSVGSMPRSHRKLAREHLEAVIRRVGG